MVEGLPPAGIKCERIFSHKEWRETTICGNSPDGVYAAFYDGDGLMGWGDNCKFRPIQTHKDKVIEAILRTPTSYKWISEEDLVLLYDHGFLSMPEGDK